MSTLRVGIDAVSIARWRAAANNPAFTEGVLTSRERMGSLVEQAACFATKEAVIKCLDSSVLLHDLRTASSGPEGVRLTGSFAKRADQLGLTTWRTSWCCDGRNVVAIVIAA